MIALVTLAVWLYLFFGHGRFWSTMPELAPRIAVDCPDVDIIVPARDEAATIGPVILSLLAQEYGGRHRVILVDDDSSDGTTTRAGSAPQLSILRAAPKPPDWSGKLWALDQGVAASQAPLLLFADADIVHDSQHLSTLVARLGESLDMVSEMVRLNCTSLAERALVPAFVYFFQLLYPFARVNRPGSGVAAAAGGTVLIRRTALQRIGGLAAIRGALIDDVTLARAVKREGCIFLGHSRLAESIRPYPQFVDIWRMVSRTAFTQLHYSWLLLCATLFGLSLLWWAPLGTAVFCSGWRRYCGIAAFALGAASYVPTLARYRRSPLWAIGLPLIALFYMGATVDSALTHWRGRGARWKNRHYGGALGE